MEVDNMNKFKAIFKSDFNLVFSWVLWSIISTIMCLNIFLFKFSIIPFLLSSVYMIASFILYKRFNINK